MTQEPHVRMRRALDEPLQAPAWPDGIAPQSLDQVDARKAHGVLSLAFPGLVAPFEDWHGNLLADEEYDPALCIVATTAGGEVVGLVQSWTSNFIKDLAVAPAWRRRGIGEALMRHTFALFAERGAPHLDLKVGIEEIEPQRLYRRLGMTPVQ